MRSKGEEKARDKNKKIFPKKKIILEAEPRPMVRPNESHDDITLTVSGRSVAVLAVDDEQLRAET